MCGEARDVLRADAADFLFNGCQLEVSTNESTYQGASNEQANSYNFLKYHFICNLYLYIQQIVYRTYTVACTSRRVLSSTSM
jgi:hypothetical protein